MESMSTSQKETENESYCVCRSIDGSRSMICCEKCRKWFHGDCMNITEKEGKSVEHCFCPECVVGVADDGMHNFQKETSKKEDKTEKQISNPKIFLKDCLKNEGNSSKNYSSGNKFVDTQETSWEEFYNKANIVMTRSRTIDGKRRDGYLERSKKETCKEINCIKPARIRSKYCSEKCGMAFNTRRLLSVVRELITRAKKVPVDETEEEVREEDENKIYCVTCGWEIPVQTAGRHMEFCFRKIESQTIVASATRSNSEHCKIFCDFYDQSTKTYCKRLRYVCPNHYKPAKAKENEVCGYPIVETVQQDICSDVITKFCQQLKKNCCQHVNWESLFLAEIDLDRFREQNKINTLVEEEALLMRQLAKRPSVMGLLLHSTTVHD